MRARTLAALLLLLPWLWTAAPAATVDGITFPDRIQEEGKTLVLNGMAVRALTFLQLRIYAAGLYVQQRSQDAGVILRSPDLKALLLQFLRSGSKSRVEEALRDAERRTCGPAGCSPPDVADFERLIQAFPPVQAGDVALFLVGPRSLRVLLNDRMVADFPNPRLGVRVLESYIGPHPPAEALRTALLGRAPG